ncbi:MAG TPA: beta-propeller fold lactonase family protein [Nitrososphaeraceae archaeon]
MNKLFKNIMMGIFAVILLTSTLTLGVQNGINTPNIERNNSDNNGENKNKGSQHPIIQIAEAVKEIHNEGNYEGYIHEKSYSKEKEEEQKKQQRLQYNSLETTSEYGKVNEVTIKAEKLPNGQYAYRMLEHILIDGQSEEDLTDRYPLIPTIPGPSIEINQNDLLIIHSIDESGEQKTQRIEPKEIGSFEYFGDRFRTLGLFGAIIVNPIDKVPAQLGGKVVSVDVNTLDKQFVLFMVGSTFWGQEIDANHNQKPLWTNPTLGADLNQVVRFHILGAAHQHTFHLHAHRWLDPGTTDIIDTKLIQPNTPHWFIVEAGDRVGTGDWQYHCHVFAHMEAGMMGTFRVGKVGEGTESLTGPGPSVIGGPPEQQGQGNFITFDISDEPGKWFRNVGGPPRLNDGTEVEYATESLAVVQPGATAHFIMSSTNTVHTVTSLLWPTGAPNMPFDEMTGYRGGAIVQLEKPGLYVFTCKIHPYMFGGMIVDDPSTEGYDLGEQLSLSTGTDLDPIDETGKENKDAIATALVLLRTFFVANNPSNWIDYTKEIWNPKFPNIPINFGGMVANLQDSLLSTVGGSDIIDLEELREGQLKDPEIGGIGEVWVDTQFEKTAHKSKPGTATRVNVENWDIERKVALPQINMNNPHNMWSDREQEVIYQTQWFDNMLTAFDRHTGKLLDNIRVGDAPSHVMTKPATDSLYVALSGEQGVAELKFNKENNKFEMKRIIPMQDAGQFPTHPHAHWISSDGTKMITPNHFTDDVTIYDFGDPNTEIEQIQSRTPTDSMPIATGMTPDGKTAYVANLLSSTISVVDMESGEVQKTIDLPASGHALPIQTPVSPDGKYVVTANTLSGTIAIIDTKTNKIVADLPCDPGCHGVNFGAKEGGGYYAYVSSKFSNRLIVVDGDPNNDKNPMDAQIAGSVLLTGDYDIGVPLFDTDDQITKYHGMGGQGVYAIPNVYSGWVQQLDLTWNLTPEQRDPLSAIDNEQQQLEQQQLEQQQLEQQQLEQQQLDELQQYQNEQQLETKTPESFANKIAKQRQQLINQAISPNPQSQFNNNEQNSSTLLNSQQPQEQKTSQSIEEKLAQIQRQSVNQALAPKLIEENVNPSLEKVGNIISMLPIPYP